MELGKGKEVAEKACGGWEALPNSEDDRQTTVGLMLRLPGRAGEAFTLSSAVSCLVALRGTLAGIEPPSITKKLPTPNGNAIVLVARKEYYFKR